MREEEGELQAGRRREADTRGRRTEERGKKWGPAGGACPNDFFDVLVGDTSKTSDMLELFF
jgi:hypothetical protein